jgi:hypothetical protein
MLGPHAAVSEPAHSSSATSAAIKLCCTGSTLSSCGHVPVHALALLLLLQLLLLPLLILHGGTAVAAAAADVAGAV